MAIAPARSAASPPLAAAPFSCSSTAPGLPSSRVQAIALAAAKEELETQEVARDLCLTPHGSQKAVSASRWFGSSTSPAPSRRGSSAGASQGQAELQERVRLGVQAEALRRKLVQFQTEGEGEFGTLKGNVDTVGTR